MSISKRFAKGEMDYNDRSLRSTGLNISQRATSTHTRSTRDRFCTSYSQNIQILNS